MYQHVLAILSPSPRQPQPRSIAMHKSIVLRLATVVLAVAVSLFALAAQAVNVTWNGGNGDWDINTTTNWTGGATVYNDGDAVTFTSTASGSVYIGTASGPTPANVAPLSVTITGGTYTFSGGDITSGSLSQSGGTATFTRDLTFGGGTTLSSGTLVFNPASAGTYGLGSGAIIINSGSFKLGGPTTGTTTLTNNITLGGATVLWDVASTTTHPAILSGNITLTGNPTFGNAHAYTPRRPLQITGTIDLNGADRTISSWNEVARATVPQIIGNVVGAGIHSLSLGPNWTGRGILIGGDGGWNIKNLNVGIQEIWVSPTADSTDFFSGIRANGGKVTIAQPQSGPGVMHLQGGAYHLDDFQPANTARLTADLSSGRTVNVLGGTLNATNNPNGLWLTPGAGTLAGDLTVASGGVLRNIYYSSAGTPTTRYGAGSDSLRLLGGSVYEVATGAGDWNSQVRLALQAQNAGDWLRLGDGDAGTAETVTFRGATNVAYAPLGNPPPTRGFIIQFNNDQIVDDGNVVLRYETPATNPLITATSLTATGGYNSTDRLIFGWSDRTSSTIQYQFRGGSAGTEFVPRVAAIDVLGPQAGTVFTATSPTTVTVAGTVGFYNSTAAMDRGSLGAVVVDNGGSLLTAITGATVNASTITVNNGGLLAAAASGSTISASATVVVNAGGTLGGNGTVATPLVTVNSNGEVAPGNSVGTLTIDGSATFASGASLVIEIDGLTSDLLIVTGALNLLDGAVLEIVGTPVLGVAYHIATYGSLGGVQEFGTVLFGSRYVLEYGLGDGGNEIWFTSIPEPTSLALLGLAALALARRRRGQ